MASHGLPLALATRNNLRLYKRLLKTSGWQRSLTHLGIAALDRIDVWFQDEARFGQQNTTTRIWAEKGTRPRAVKQQQFESAYLYGAVCPATGATQAIIAPHANSEYMNEHLKLISAATAFGRHALVIMDGAGWHQQDLADDFDNLTLLKLPPYSPELNPIEQVWQWLRQNVLANRCFSGYDVLLNSALSHGIPSLRRKQE